MPDYLDPFGDGFPGPYLTINVEWGGQSRDLLALLDTGADLTQIPQLSAEALQLQQVGVQPTTSAKGVTTERPVYVANLTFQGLNFPTTWMVGDDYAIALVGRDVLNELIARFDGPALSFDLHQPTAAPST